ncbi:MAG TPA: DUF2975 domain-containing protein [Candidatus Didemnitutus sp.]|nr:DUF2975 domain-containing protein [Candidatus Didemnitutus sp.]
MKNRSALLLQSVLVVFGAAVLAFLLWEPHLEGRNAHATTFEIYFQDPFLAYVYVGSLPFFVAVYRAFRLLGEFRIKGSFSRSTVDSLRVIRICGLSLVGFVAVGVVFILIFGDKDDRPAGFFMSLLVTLVAGLIAFAATRFARKVQRDLSRSADRR